MKTVTTATCWFQAQPPSHIDTEQRHFNALKEMERMCIASPSARLELLVLHVSLGEINRGQWWWSDSV